MMLSITSKSGVKSKIKPPPPGVTVILDAHNFDEVVMVSIEKESQMGHNIYGDVRILLMTFSSHSR